MRKPRWYEKLAPKEVEELNAFMADKSMKYKDIAELYGISPAELSHYAAHIGLMKRATGALPGRSLSPDHKAALALAQKRAWAEGKYASNLGKKRSPETRKKMSDAKKIAWANGAYKNRGNRTAVQT
jgi:hypothetical protein